MIPVGAMKVNAVVNQLMMMLDSRELARRPGPAWGSPGDPKEISPGRIPGRISLFVRHILKDAHQLTRNGLHGRKAVARKKRCWHLNRLPKEEGMKLPWVVDDNDSL